MGQETIEKDEDEVIFDRPTGALLTPKELWYTSPELIEMFRVQGRQLESNIPPSYNARDLGKDANFTQHYPTPYVILK